MSNKFNGFTMDEIHKINSKPEYVKKSNGGTVRKHTIKKLNGDTKATEVNKSAMVAKGDINQNHNALGSSPSTAAATTAAHDTSNLSESTIQAFRETLHYQPLSQSQSQSPIYDFVKSAQSNNNANDQTARIEGGEGPEKVDAVAAATTTAESNTHNNGVGRTVSHELDSRALFQGISLKDFERHHKLMKEANVEKRRLLSSAIEQRFEQSIAEATKIAKIREELEKLDQELAADVEILRKEIEAVTQQYTATKETYNQIESQFLAAKLSLHQITEKKEMLTEHLCTIISHNEDRKAKKLTELLDKVGLNQGTDLSANITQNNTK